MRKHVRERLAKITAKRPAPFKKRGYFFILPDGTKQWRQKPDAGQKPFYFTVKPPVEQPKITRLQDATTHH